MTKLMSNRTLLNILDVLIDARGGLTGTTHSLMAGEMREHLFGYRRFLESYGGCGEWSTFLMRQDELKALGRQE